MPLAASVELIKKPGALKENPPSSGESLKLFILLFPKPRALSRHAPLLPAHPLLPTELRPHLPNSGIVLLLIDTTPCLPALLLTSEAQRNEAFLSDNCLLMPLSEPTQECLSLFLKNGKK